MPKQELILEGWEKLYPGMIEWVPSTQDGTVVAVDAKTGTVLTQLGEHRAEIANTAAKVCAGAVAALLAGEQPGAPPSSTPAEDEDKDLTVE
jgi:hypothetical protein